MPKVAKELTALEISRLTKKGRYPVGSNLYLKVDSPQSRSWVLIITVGKKRRYIGLGAYPATTLAQARERARQHKDLIAQGIDPIEQKKAAQSALLAQQAKEITFQQCAHAYVDIHSSSWKNAKHIQNWGRSLELYVYPTIGNMLVRDVEQAHILKILESIWISM